MLNTTDIYKWFDVVKNRKLVEIRVIGNGRVWSGYFRDATNLINSIAPLEDCNIYYTINAVKEDCYSRAQKEQMLQKPKETTTDNEITGRDWVFLDLDAKRVTGVNATDEELQNVKAKAREVYRFLLNSGFYRPVIIMSGNGVHFLIRCSLDASPGNDEIIRRFTLAMSMLFSDNLVDIDEKVFNRARIAKLPGTYSRKGNPFDTIRPQRMCSFLDVPDDIKVNDVAYFAKIADLYPKEEKPSRENNFRSESFNLDGFLAKYGIAVSRIENCAGGQKYILEHCPFDSNHKGKDAVIFRRATGEIAFHCFHNSCSNYTWHDLRAKFDPEAYTKKDYEQYKWNQRYNSQIAPKKPFERKAETKENGGKKWLEMEDISYFDPSQIVSIPTGFRELDKAITGLMLGEVTVLSGLNGSGKSSWFNQVALNAVQRGYNTAIWSGELMSYKLKSWLYQVAAGKNNVEPISGYENLYRVPKNIYNSIDTWLKGKLVFYNNDYGNDWQQLLSDIKEKIEQSNVRLVFLDNLMALSLDSFDGDKLDRQKQFINSVVSLARQYNVHIVLVCHPRKSLTFLRKEDISGTSDITNLVDNVIIIHRNDMDFSVRATEFLGKEKVGFVLAYNYSNIIEISKNRFFGVKDKLIGMYYEVETRRFKNEMGEHIIYGWQEPISTYEFEFNDEFEGDDLPPDM